MPYPATREPALAQAAEFNSAGFNRHGMWIALDSPSRPALGRGKVLKGQAVGNDIDLHLGRRLRRRRRLLGLTQQQLAQAVGVRFQQIQKYECGANRISAARLWRIAAALDVPVGYFYDGLADGARLDVAANDHADGGEVLARKETLDLVRAYYQLGERPRRRLLDLAKSLNAAPEVG
jgi:transcriptional regulator with XRE-family HTH domain